MREWQPGLLDTNVFIHAHTRDSLSDECRGFLAALEEGNVHAYLDPVILHELFYALPHYVQQMSRTDIAGYLLMVLAWDGVHGEKGVMVDAVQRWRTSTTLSFADAYLAALATHSGVSVFSKNVRELEAQGVPVGQWIIDTSRPPAPAGTLNTVDLVNLFLAPIRKDTADGITTQGTLYCWELYLGQWAAFRPLFPYQPPLTT